MNFISKIVLGRFFTIFISLLLSVNSIFALDVPFLSGRIVDEIGILNSATKASIEKQLAEHEKLTSNQVAILIIPSLEGEVLEEYSIKVATTWKLGQKDKDNGVLLLIAKNDRKLRIEVGYGLEGVLTDALSNRIIRKEITPSFKNGDFSTGIERGVNSILNAINGNYSIPEGSKEDSFEMQSDLADQLGESDFPLIFRLVFGGMFLLVITPFTLAAAFAPYIGWLLYFFLIPFYATFPVIALGKWGKLLLPIYCILMLVFKIYLSFTPSGKKYMKKRERRLKAIAKASGGKSGGWSFGGGGSGGGGGGFSGGGGSFGGGGSSGSW